MNYEACSLHMIKYYYTIGNKRKSLFYNILKGFLIHCMAEKFELFSYVKMHSQVGNTYVQVGHTYVQPEYIGWTYICPTLLVYS